MDHWWYTLTQAETIQHRYNNNNMKIPGQSHLSNKQILFLLWFTHVSTSLGLRLQLLKQMLASSNMACIASRDFGKHAPKLFNKLYFNCLMMVHTGTSNGTCTIIIKANMNSVMISHLCTHNGSTHTHTHTHIHTYIHSHTHTHTHTHIPSTSRLNTRPFMTEDFKTPEPYIQHRHIATLTIMYNTYYLKEHAKLSQHGINLCQKHATRTCACTYTCMCTLKFYDNNIYHNLSHSDIINIEVNRILGQHGNYRREKVNWWT